MKNSFENSIKESLKDFEMPYNPKAWQAMSSKLDAGQPASLENGMKESLQELEMPYNPKAWQALRAKLDIVRPIAKPGSNFKWYAIAATAVVASVGAYFYFTHDSHNNTAETLVKNDTMQTIEQELNGSLNSTTNNNSGSEQHLNTNGSVNNSSTEQVGNAENSIAFNTNGESSDQASTNGSSSSDQSQVNSQQSSSSSNGSGTNNGSDKPTNNGDAKINFVVPAVSSICLNEEIKLENNNELKLWVIAPSGQSFVVKPMQTNTFEPTEEGVHKLGYYHDQSFVEKGAFNVKSLPFVDFYIDQDQKYKNGVPVTKVETNVPGTRFEWKMGQFTVDGREAEGHFFRKGYYDITLNVTGANGCVNSKTENIFIEHEFGDRGNYNLLAPSGIYLNSTDEKNRTFMPEGLKLRDVQFRMVIYSLQDGHIVYETQDSSKPWNGVDQKTGRQVGHATSYQWEITIENPMPGESPSYKGGLTVLIN